MQARTYKPQHCWFPSCWSLLHYPHYILLSPYEWRLIVSLIFLHTRKQPRLPHNSPLPSPLPSLITSNIRKISHESPNPILLSLKSDSLGIIYDRGSQGQKLVAARARSVDSCGEPTPGDTRFLVERDKFEKAERAAAPRFLRPPIRLLDINLIWPYLNEMISVNKTKA